MSYTEPADRSWGMPLVSGGEVLIPSLHTALETCNVLLRAASPEQAICSQTDATEPVVTGHRAAS